MRLQHLAHLTLVRFECLQPFILTGDAAEAHNRACMPPVGRTPTLGRRFTAGCDVFLRDSPRQGHSLGHDICFETTHEN